MRKLTGFGLPAFLHGVYAESLFVEFLMCSNSPTQSRQTMDFHPALGATNQN